MRSKCVNKELPCVLQEASPPLLLSSFITVSCLLLLEHTVKPCLQGRGAEAQLRLRTAGSLLPCHLPERNSEHCAGADPFHPHRQCGQPRSSLCSAQTPANLHELFQHRLQAAGLDPRVKWSPGIFGNSRHLPPPQTYF